MVLAILMTIKKKWILVWPIFFFFKSFFLFMPIHRSKALLNELDRIHALLLSQQREKRRIVSIHFFFVHNINQHKFGPFTYNQIMGFAGYTIKHKFSHANLCVCETKVRLPRILNCPLQPFKILKQLLFTIKSLISEFQTLIIINLSKTLQIYGSRFYFANDICHIWMRLRIKCKAPKLNLDIYYHFWMRMAPKSWLWDYLDF